MTIPLFIFYIIILPFLLLFVVATVATVYAGWILLFAICGVEWAQKAWHQIDNWLY